MGLGLYVVLAVILALLLSRYVFFRPFGEQTFSALVVLGIPLAWLIYAIVQRLRAKPTFQGPLAQPPTYEQSRAVLVGVGLIVIALGLTILFGAFMRNEGMGWQVAVVAGGFVLVYFGWRVGRNKDNTIPPPPPGG